MKKKNRTVRRAFTLIEMLIATSIVAILCSLTLTGLSAMRRQADLAGCASNLRQIGAGVILYAAENNSTLPGPTYGAQGPREEIALSIAPYLNGTNTINTIFTCPAWERNPEHLASGKKPYYAGKSVKLADEKTDAYPFGYKGKEGNTPPVRLTAILQPAQAAALTDLDQLLNNNSAAVAKPSHEKFRNTLYFDGHVQAASIANP
jgi:prepilin-type N-terminal cleavage/methylation domain-containing protein/prepilin-type processing-associated H-X9-DG protein